jgi:hypothetical protein
MLMTKNIEMNTSALIMWLGSVLIVTGFTVYFFSKVLKNPNK